MVVEASLMSITNFVIFSALLQFCNLLLAVSRVAVTVARDCVNKAVSGSPVGNDDDDMSPAEITVAGGIMSVEGLTLGVVLGRAPAPTKMQIQ